MSRFFVLPDKVAGDVITIDNKGDIRHIINVLRLGEGSKIEVSDSVNWEYSAEIISVDSELIKLKILEKKRFSREPHRRITLFQSIPKQKKMDEIVRKSIELGVSEIIPVFTSRSIVDKKSNMIHKLERWRRIASETVKQCKRGRVPLVDEPMSFEHLLKYITAFDLVLLPYENEIDISIKYCLKHLHTDPDRIAIIIGPEGGFEQEEVDLMTDNNAISVNLGKLVLRTETAGPTAIALVMYELEMN